ncbi:hypothetical protein [Stx2 converting phage I]|uniref:Uncharacterized protein n=1 Tax=Stx2 converting phage I TaxID=180816 RepID=Q8SC40_9CAUD|nr:hypothetical protein [Stx2 converting phage I]
MIRRPFSRTATSNSASPIFNFPSFADTGNKAFSFFAATAFLEDSFLCSAVIFAARALPPLAFPLTSSFFMSISRVVIDKSIIHMHVVTCNI